MEDVPERSRRMKRGGLGKGLSALIPGAGETPGAEETTPAGKAPEIPVASISPNPRQPRTDFDEAALEGLVASIREVGVLQPVVVRPSGDGYELIAGERRLRAAQRLGLVSVPAVVREASELASLQEALIENIHRADLGPIELAEAFRELLEELGATHDVVAERLGVSRPHVANTLRLLQLPAEVQSMLADGRLSAGHGRALLGLPDPEAQTSLALRAVADGLSVREVEDLVRRYTEAPVRPRRRDAAVVPSVFAEAEEQLSERLSTRVHVQMGARKGKIIVEVGSAEDLERVIAQIIGR
jgi:ParB family transcriptional regulator, chromosome partitioning protein